jgi:hypothetical protein
MYNAPAGKELYIRARGRYKLADQSKRAKLQWLQDLSQVNGDNLNNARCQVRGHFKNQEQEYLNTTLMNMHYTVRTLNIRHL